MAIADAFATASTRSHELDAASVIRELDTDGRVGLAESEARARLSRFGSNELQAERPIPMWRRFVAQFKDTLVILLIIATAVSVVVWAVEGASGLPYEAMAILAVVLLNAALGFVQETRAEAAVTALKKMSAEQATVVRDGERRRAPASELVPGDVILLEEGDTIPADARVIEATALQTAEAALTGESLPVSKDADPVDAAAGLGDRSNMLFSGTAVTYGRGRAVVTATGMQTQIGRIAGLLHETTSAPTPLQRELDRTGRLLGIIVIAIAVVVVATILIVEHVRGFAAIVSVLLLGVALAVAAVPEGLPAVVTTVLALGVRRMARRNAIVRHLSAVETLGSASVIASDKTGTLTRNEMTVRVVVTASGRVDFTGTGYQPEGKVYRADGTPLDDTLCAELERALAAADRANNATVQERDGRWYVLGDPTEGALLVAARKAGLRADVLEARFPRVGEVPFSSARKLMSTLHRDRERDERVTVFTKGAPDVLLTRCSRELVGEEPRPLTEARRLAIMRENDALASEALRTLGVAIRRFDAVEPSHDAAERDLVFAGLIGMIDPPRAEAATAVGRAMSAGIRPIMITGDHPRTAAVIARELGVARDERVVSGVQLDDMSDKQLDEMSTEIAVYARVAPEHKLRIVRALQSRGAVVAMTGDGVNDAPALKAADIGVAMGVAGTDVAKQASDVVLADDNFATIVAAVEEGRAIFANIRKFLRYLLSSNIGEVLVMFFGVLLAVPLGLPPSPGGVVLPLLATQILWVNLVTDGAPALALGVDPPDEGLMRKPPRPIGEGVITGRMWRGILLVGVVIAASTLFVLDADLPGGLMNGTHDLTHARTMAFTTLVGAQLFNALNARSDDQSAFVHLFANRWLWGAILLSLALHPLVVYVSFLQRAFGTTSLTFGDWLRCTAFGSVVLWVRELTKLISRARGR